MLKETSSKKQVFEMALCDYGWEIQSLVLIEEMGELIKEIIKIHRDIFWKRPLNLDAMVREFADVQLMLDQIKFEWTDDETDLFQQEYGLKLDKLRKRLEEGQT